MLIEEAIELDRLRVINADLLAALEGMNDDGCYAACKHYGLGKKHSVVCAAARTAIAKARGDWI